MKQLLTILMVATGFAAFSQLPYSWTANTDPGWTSSGALQWRASCNYVTTNCTGNYSNNMNVTYTSSSIDASCANASTISVTFTAFGNAEYQYDFLFIYYSLDNGATWINPYGAGVGWTGNFGSSAPGTTIPAITLPTSSNIRFRLNFQSDNSFVYTGYKITNFNVSCNVVLPVEMVSFTGKRLGNENVLSWTTLSEKDNDYFDIEWSVNPEAELWTSISRVNAYGTGNSEMRQDYSTVHSNPAIGKKNYYRITQVDKDGTRRAFDEWVVVDNTMKENPLKEIVNLMGQQVNEHTSGLVIYVYEDGTKVKKYQ